MSVGDRLPDITGRRTRQRQENSGHEPLPGGVRVLFPFTAYGLGNQALVWRSAVGVDIEAIRPEVEIARLLTRIGEPETQGSTAQLFRIWARREAKTKALGSPLMEIPDADLRVAECRYPHHRGDRGTAWGRSGDHGEFGCRPTGTPPGRNLWRHRDHLDQFDR